MATEKPVRCVGIKFCWYDLWIGAYWDRRHRILYICPLPTICICIFGLGKGGKHVR